MLELPLSSSRDSFYAVLALREKMALINALLLRRCVLICVMHPKHSDVITAIVMAALDGVSP